MIFDTERRYDTNIPVIVLVGTLEGHVVAFDLREL